MKFFEEKEARHCFAFIGMVSVFLILFILVLDFRYSECTRQLLLKQQTTLASSLMKQGVSKEVIATSFQDKTQTEEGKNLVAQMGFMPESIAIKLAISQPILKKVVPLSMLGAIFLLFLLLFGVGNYLAKRERFYIKMTKKIENFSNGDFSEHLPRNYVGSLYQLLSAVDELAMTLKSKEETQQKAKEFLKDTISDISHQLKTPLAALSMYNEIMAEEPEHLETIMKFLAKSKLALNRMEQLIQALLKTMRLDAKSIQFDKETILITDLVSQSIQDLKQRAIQEEKTIEFDGSEDETICCDLQWTSEAIGNLVKNALDHTKEYGHIIIGVRRIPGMLQLYVSDDGCGISEEDLPFIFKRFYRSKEATDQQGIGLGLPLAKAIIEEQNGILTVESTKDEGTVFTMTFLTDL